MKIKIMILPHYCIYRRKRGNVIEQKRSHQIFFIFTFSDIKILEDYAVVKCESSYCIFKVRRFHKRIHNFDYMVAFCGDRLPALTFTFVVLSVVLASALSHWCDKRMPLCKFI